MGQNGMSRARADALKYHSLTIRTAEAIKVELECVELDFYWSESKMSFNLAFI